MLWDLKNLSLSLSFSKFTKTTKVNAKLGNLAQSKNQHSVYFNYIGLTKFIRVDILNYASVD